MTHDLIACLHYGRQKSYIIDSMCMLSARHICHATQGKGHQRKKWYQIPLCVVRDIMKGNVLYHSEDITECFIKWVTICTSYLQKLREKGNILLQCFPLYVKIRGGWDCRKIIKILTHQYLRDRYGYGLSQWETMLHCDSISYWLRPYPEWSLYLMI